MSIEKKNPILLGIRDKIHLVLDSIIPKYSNCVLVDFPNYSNVGDSAIWLGEILYLKKRKCNIKYICDYDNYSQTKLNTLLSKHGLIIISGGGNFGDLYPKHQKLREQLSIDFPDNRIIQLPQSINFEDPKKLRESFDIISKHKDFHLLVRDTNSYETANQYKPILTHLCPDMALMLDIKPRKLKNKSTDVVVLSRTDKEKISTFVPDISLINRYQVFDWLYEKSPKYKWIYDWSHKRLNWNSKIPDFILTHLAIFAANAMAKERLDRGLNILNRGHVVITDRLHALLISWLVQLPVYFIDNNYGKLSNFTNTWLHNCYEIKKCGTFEEAINSAIKK